MTRALPIRVVGALGAVLALALTAFADPLLDDRVWSGGTGSQNWQLNSNWMPSPFPNDPGRNDVNPGDVTPSIGANLSVPLASNLTVSVGSSDVTVAALTIGSTTGAVTTSVSSSGGRLVFENFEVNTTSAHSQPSFDTLVVTACSFNCGNAQITSQGVAGAINVISAIVGLHDQVDVVGTKDITLAGGIQEMGTPSTLQPYPVLLMPDGSTRRTDAIAALNASSAGQTVYVSGNIQLLNMADPFGDDVPFGLNTGVSHGTIDVSGTISGGGGRLTVGSTVLNHPGAPGTVILRGANTHSGGTYIGLGNLVLANDNALGTGRVQPMFPPRPDGRWGGQTVGRNVLSDNDNRRVDVEMNMHEWMTVKGEHSLEWDGLYYQSHSYGWINLLPEGKQFTLSADLYAAWTQELLMNGFPPSGIRVLHIDGSGRTVISGGLHDEYNNNPGNDPTAGISTRFRKRGTGTVLITGGQSTFTGVFDVQGGSLNFATLADVANATQIVSTGGAVGVNDGVFQMGGNFLNRLDPANNTGGLMLGTSEYGQNLDFTSGSLTNAANMSLAAHPTGSTYTGTITPSGSTYRLGGGKGTLSLPNANQLTGSRSVLITNGGEVILNNTNNYSGATRLVAKYHNSGQERAAIDDYSDPNDYDQDYRGSSFHVLRFGGNPNAPKIQGFSSTDWEEVWVDGQIRVGTTLTVSNLSNGGANSSIGTSSNSAGNLYIEGSTLKYVGAATSTDRLFTVGTGGSKIDASGTGALTFSNTSALGIDVAESRTGTILGFAGGNTTRFVTGLTTTEDLQPGMAINHALIPDGTAVITHIESATSVGISKHYSTAALGFGVPISFGAAPERKLTLTGNNNDNNTLNPIVGNASDGGVVGITKQGTGKWIMSGNNSYTGPTNVEAGTLLVNGNQTGNGLTTVSTGAAFGGTGAIGGGLVMDAGSTFVTQFAGGTIDPLAISGNVDLSALGNALQVLGSGTGSNWLLATYTGALTGVFESVTSGYSVDYGTAGQIRLLAAAAPGLPGDYNADGKVDAADYTVWRNNLGAPNESAINNNGNGGGITDSDYTWWKQHYGTMSGGGGLATSAVPEPASWMMISLGLVGPLLRRRVRA